MQIVSNGDNLHEIQILFTGREKNKIWHFMQIVSNGDNLHEIQILFTGKIRKRSSICCLLK